ncbi:uncharacterized protein CBL_04682 [Carabus blaptoides fortunei]
MFKLKVATCFIAYLATVHGQIVSDASTLKQVHILFRHGQRTPSLWETYPNDPYINKTYYPIGRGELTKFGKFQEYYIGLNLRQRYAKFLGDIYTPDVLEARSTDFSRTKMSLQLVLAGLWPPGNTQQWNYELNWQPIPFNYEPAKKDQILTLPILCKNMNEEHEKLFSLESVKDALEMHKWLFDYVNQHTGLNATRPVDLMLIYFALATQESLGLRLPEWSSMVYPYALTEMAVMEYNLRTFNDHLKQNAAGGLIKKIRDDITAIINGNKATKLYLYSAHELNVASTLLALNTYYPHVPGYGSYILVELHKINNQYGVQLFYSENSFAVPTPIVLPGCNHFCPLSIFTSLTEHVITDSQIELNHHYSRYMSFFVMVPELPVPLAYI